MSTVPTLHMQTQPTPLVDDPAVREIYADELVGLSLNNGNVSMTFAVTRADHTKNPAPNFRRVTARVTVPVATLVNVENFLGPILKDMETKGIIKKGPPQLNVVQ